MLWNTATAPTGFNFCDGNNGTEDYRNVYIRGAATNADAGSTGGSYTNVHNIDHTHNENGHSHAGYITGGTCTAGGARAQGGGSNEFISQGHDHYISLASATAGINGQTIDLTTTETVEPAYKKIAMIKNTSGGSLLKRGSIAMYLGSVASVPVGWNICDGTKGTPDLRDKFIKIINTTDEIGNTGGSNTHTHASQNHNHTGGNHTHGNASSADWGHSAGDRSQRAVGGGRGINKGNNPHDQQTVSTDAASWNNTGTTADSSSNQPAYRTVVYIQFDFSLGGALLMATI